MSIRMVRKCKVAASLALMLSVGNLAGGKPPDLPSASVETVREQDAPKDAKRAAARRLYLIGERCRRVGDLDMAVNCYHETDLLSPTSVYARKARLRLKEIEAQQKSEAD